MFVNTGTGRRLLSASEWDDGLLAGRYVFRLDSSTGDRVVRESFSGTVRLDGYGVAVVINAATDVEVD